MFFEPREDQKRDDSSNETRQQQRARDTAVKQDDESRAFDPNDGSPLEEVRNSDSPSDSPRTSSSKEKSSSDGEDEDDIIRILITRKIKTACQDLREVQVLENNFELSIDNWDVPTQEDRAEAIEHLYHINNKWENEARRWKKLQEKMNEGQANDIAYQLDNLMDIIANVQDEVQQVLILLNHEQPTRSAVARASVSSARNSKSWSGLPARKRREKVIFQQTPLYSVVEQKGVESDSDEDQWRTTPLLQERLLHSVHEKHWNWDDDFYAKSFFETKLDLLQRQPALEGKKMLLKEAQNRHRMLIRERDARHRAFRRKNWYRLCWHSSPIFDNGDLGIQEASRGVSLLENKVKEEEEALAAQQYNVRFFAKEVSEKIASILDGSMTLPNIEQAQEKLLAFYHKKFRSMRDEYLKEHKSSLSVPLENMTWEELIPKALFGDVPIERTQENRENPVKFRKK